MPEAHAAWTMRARHRRFPRCGHAPRTRLLSSPALCRSDPLPQAGEGQVANEQDSGRAGATAAGGIAAEIAMTPEPQNYRDRVFAVFAGSGGATKMLPKS